MTNLDIAFNYLIKYSEGTRYTNDPNDRGGPTRYGITKKTYEAYCGHEANEDEIRFMTPELAKQIYAANYWAKLGCSEIAALAFAVAIFDTGVLYGVGRSARMIQQALALCGAPIKVTGLIDDKSIDFINKMGGGSEPARTALMNSFHGLILKRIDAVIVARPSNKKYRRGWTARADRLLELLDDDFIKDQTIIMEMT